MGSLLRFGTRLSRYKLHCQSVKLVSSNTSWYIQYNPIKFGNEQLRTLATQFQATRLPRRIVTRRRLDDSFQRLGSTVQRRGRVSRQQFDDVLHRIGKQGSVSPTQSRQILKCCGALLAEERPRTRNELVTKVLDMLNKMHVTLNIDHYNTVLKVYLDNEHELDPVQFLSDLEVVPNLITYQHLIALGCQSGDLEGTTKVLLHMKENGIAINREVFNSLIVGHGRARDLESAREVFNIMRDVDLEPGSDTYAALSLAYAENGDVEAVRRLLDEAEHKNLRLTNLGYFNIIFALAKNGDDSKMIQHITDKLDDSSSGFINECILTTQKLVNIGQHETAFRVVMLMDSLTESPWKKVPAGSIFLRQLVQHDADPEVIVDYCREMKVSKKYPLALLKATELALIYGKFDHFSMFVRELKAEKFQIRQHYFWPVLLACEKDDPSQIYEILQRMIDYEIPATYVTFSEYAYPVLFSAETVIVPDVIKKLEAMGHDEKLVVGSMVEYFVGQKNVKQAADLVDQYSFVVTPSSLYSPLARAFVNTGDVTSTIKILKLLSQSVSLDREEERLKIDWTGLFLLRCLSFGYKYHRILESLMIALKEHDLLLSPETYDEINWELGSERPYFVKFVRSITIPHYKLSTKLLHEPSDCQKEGLPAREALEKLFLLYGKKEDSESVKRLKENFAPAMLEQPSDVISVDKTVDVTSEIHEESELREFNEPIPFVVPEKQTVSKPVKYERSKRHQAEKLQSKSTPESSSSSQLSPTVARISSPSDNMDVKTICDLLDQRQQSTTEKVKSTLNEWARNGDVDRLKALQPMLSTIMKKMVFFTSVLMQAHVYKGTHEMMLDELELNVRKTHLCPAGGFLFLLERHPELLERVQKLARNYTKYDYYGLLNVIWMYHFKNENYEAADKLFKETPRLSFDLRFQGILREARAKKNVPMLERLLEVVKTIQFPMKPLAKVYEEIVAIQQSLRDTEGVQKTLEKAKQDGINDLIRLDKI